MTRAARRQPPRGRYPDPAPPVPAPSAPATEPPPPSANPAQPESALERLAYSVDETARLTGLSRDLLYDEMRRGHLPYLKVGRRRLITRHHLRQFLSLPADPATTPAQE